MSTKNAYFAGLIDGEGTIAVEKKYPLSSGNCRGCIEVKMTCQSTITELHSHFGGNVFYRPSKNDKWKPQWRWRARDAIARNAVRLIYPYLICKKDDANEVIAMWKAKGLW